MLNNQLFFYIQQVLIESCNFKRIFNRNRFIITYLDIAPDFHVL